MVEGKMKFVESINEALHRLMRDNEKVIFMGEDILDPYGGAFKAARGLSSAFGDRVISTPVSEAGMTGFAVGLAMSGFRPIVEIMFGDFLTLTMDQLVNSASKFKWMFNEQLEVPLLIRTPMGGRRGYGATHSQTLETLFLNVPGITIIAPSLYHEPGKLLYDSVQNTSEPVLFIENKLLYPQKLKRADEAGKVGEFNISEIKSGEYEAPTFCLSLGDSGEADVTLIAYGGMASLAAEAAFNMFMQEEILVEVLVPSLVKPVPANHFTESAARSGKVLIIEESVGYSGWGAELASQLSEQSFSNLKLPIKRLGALPVPIPCSKPLEEEVLVQLKDVEAALSDMVKG